MRREYQHVYDDWDPDRRNEVDVIGYPLVDETGREVKLYNQNGCKVARRLAGVYDGQEPCGVLLDLRHIEELLSAGGDDVDLTGSDWDDGTIDLPDMKINVFPVSFLRDYGHFQANGVLQSFCKTMQGINNVIGRRPPPAGSVDGDEDSEDVEDTVVKRALHAVSSQGYNELSHRVATKASSHEVQQGRIMAALAGAYATTPKAQAIAKKALEACEAKLPFDRFMSKISAADCPRSLRMEQVYYIDLATVCDCKRNGAYVDFSTIHQG